ncbi:UNVERIFIED_CONTAM: D-alanyl-D-alanine carboxypeptidase [Brevibacillus sp. OAP136]
MKKWVFLFVILLLLLGYKVVQPKLGSGQDHQRERHIGDSSQEYQTINIENGQVYQGNLLLVNKDYPVHPDGIKSDVVDLSLHKELVNGYRLLDDRIQLSESVVQAFTMMVHAAISDHVSHFIINSGYRSLDEQRRLYKEMGSDYALPAGYSEHNLGVSLDIGSTQMKMEQAPEGKWLKENSWKYGFILRYPEDKADITGISYEPWHYRYIGLPHSAIMQERHLTLEQYLDALRNEKDMTAIVDGKTFEISYYPISQSDTIQVPINRHYEISGDNREGVIVTVYP